jgi:hypothetical protein
LLPEERTHFVKFWLMGRTILRKFLKKSPRPNTLYSSVIGGFIQRQDLLDHLRRGKKNKSREMIRGNKGRRNTHRN